jgi:hypothetical protein
MSFDPRVYRNKDGIGMPSDPAATDATASGDILGPNLDYV